MTFSGTIGLLSIFFRIFTLSFLAIPGFVAGVFGGVIYGLATAYININREDEISDWINKSIWGVRKNLEENEKIWDENIDGYRECLEALNKMRERPKVFLQPTLTSSHMLNEENVDGTWLFIELPRSIHDQKIRIDFMSYPDSAELNIRDIDYQYINVDSLGVHESHLWTAEWIEGYVPYKNKSSNQTESRVLIPTTKSEDFSIEAWSKSFDSIVLKLWLPRRWMPSGVIGFRRCPALLFVWYGAETDFDSDEQIVLSKPYAFKLDLSLQSDESLSNSFSSGTLMNESETKGSRAYKKLVELANETKFYNLLNVGYKDENQ